MMDGASWMGWWMLFGMLFFFLFWVGVVAVAVWAASGFRSKLTSERDPIDIAKQRYARGEISREQLQQISDDLHKAA